MQPNKNKNMQGCLLAKKWKRGRNPKMPAIKHRHHQTNDIIPLYIPFRLNSYDRYEYSDAL